MFDNSFVEFCVLSVLYVVKKFGFILENYYFWFLVFSMWNYDGVKDVILIE